MKKVGVRLFFVLTVVASFSLYADAQKINVAGSIEESSIKTGKIGKGSIILSIPNELHINSNKPTSEFMIPTKLSLSSKNVKIGKITYPKGKDRKFDFSEEAINVYEGKTIINFTFSIPKTLKSKSINIRALISYQACTNEVCYAPQKTNVILKGEVASKL